MALPYNFINNRGYGIREGRVALGFACEKSIIVWSFFLNFYSLLIFLLTDGVYILALFPPPGGGGGFFQDGEVFGEGFQKLTKRKKKKLRKKLGRFSRSVCGGRGGVQDF